MVELTAEEKAALEWFIGIGSVEMGGPLDDATASACRKLGLNPVDWHGNRLLDEVA